MYGYTKDQINFISG